MRLLIMLLIAFQLLLIESYCPQATLPFNGGCVVASVLYLDSQQAEGICNYMGGHLTSIHSDQMNNDLFTYLQRVYSYPPPTPKRMKESVNLKTTELKTTRAMIGSYRTNSSSGWINYDNSSFDYNNFPNLPYIPSYDNLAYMDLMPTNGSWGAMNGTSDGEIYFVCTIPDCLTPFNNTRKCPLGTEYAQTMDRCLLGQKRSVPPRQLQYWQTEDACAQIGGHLVSIQNAFQNTEIFNIAEDLLIEDFYIGFQEELKIEPCKPWMDCQGWSWVDGANTTYTNFYSPIVEGHGDLTIMQTENVHGSSQAGQWQQTEDGPCTDQNCFGRDYICSIPTYRPQLCLNF